MAAKKMAGVEKAARLCRERQDDSWLATTYMYFTVRLAPWWFLVLCCVLMYREKFLVLLAHRENVCACVCACPCVFSVAPATS